MKKPNFFIIGAPKCGTTSLYFWLSEHPKVYMSPEKEPDYFYGSGKISSLKDYERLFAEAGPMHDAVGEASAKYLYSKRAVPAILEYTGDQAKFVVMLRNPVEMAPSLHDQLVYNFNETELDFEKAWRKQNQDETPRNDLLNHSHFPEMANYGPVCKLGEQLERLSRIISPAQCKAILLEDLKSSPRQVWLALMEFMEIEDDERILFDVKNRAKTVRSRFFHRSLSRLGQAKKKFGMKQKTGLLSPLIKWNNIERSRPPLSESMRAELRAYFRDDIRKLESILNRDLSHWR